MLYASVVVGSGVVGLTAAVLLRRAGLTAAVVEPVRIAVGVSGHTTGKVTAGHGLAYSRLEWRPGGDATRVYAQSQSAAVERVFELAAGRLLGGRRALREARGPRRARPRRGSST